VTGRWFWSPPTRRLTVSPSQKPQSGEAVAILLLLEPTEHRPLLPIRDRRMKKPAAAKPKRASEERIGVQITLRGTREL
jgi:hypothetical protein